MEKEREFPVECEHDVICIGDNIEVRVLKTQKGQVRLGISVPDDVSVLREEVAWGIGDSVLTDP